MRLCDLHTHVLPGVDDGARDMETSLEMLKNAVCSDVAALALTPHCIIEDEAGAEQTEDFLKGFRELCREAKALEIDLFLGAEVHVTPFLFEYAEQLRLPTLNASRYLLTEFPFYFPAEAYQQVLERLLEAGVIPVVAHPERYEAVMHDPSLAALWVEMGCHLQLTGSSVTGEFGKRAKAASDFLLNRDLVCCVASDAHDLRHRTNFLLEAFDHLTMLRSREYARILMWENPIRILSDQDL